MKSVSTSTYSTERTNYNQRRRYFHVVNENILLFILQWKNCVSLCTDGSPSMQESKKGFVTFVLQENSNVFVAHCMIHREPLVFRFLPKYLMFVQDQVITIVNFIKSRPLASRLFRQFYEAINSNHKRLLYHINVLRLSRGKLLKRAV